MDSGRSWQPYADHLVYSALAALPWGGSELAESAPAEVRTCACAQSVHKPLKDVRPVRVVASLPHSRQGGSSVI